MSYDMKTGKGKLVYGIFVGLLVLIVIIALFPLIWAALTGFKNLPEYYKVPPTLFPEEWNFKNVTELFTVYKVQNYVFNTFIVVIGALVVCLCTTALGGFVLSRIKPTGSKLVFTLVLWTMMMPGTLTMVPLFLTFIDFPILNVSLMNTPFPMWIIAGASCYHLILFKDFFDSIPASYIESAQIDGASKLKIFTSIVLPLSKPILATVAVFVIIANWNDFMWPLLILKDQELWTLSLAMYNFKGQMEAPQVMMLAFLSIIPMVIIYYISQRFVATNSITEGVKG